MPPFWDGVINYQLWLYGKLKMILYVYPIKDNDIIY